EGIALVDRGLVDLEDLGEEVLDQLQDLGPLAGTLLDVRLRRHYPCALLARTTGRVPRVGVAGQSNRSTRSATAGGEVRARRRWMPAERGSATVGPMGGRGPGGRDWRCGAPEGVRDAQSTSMAWRPPYHPQLPHTTWGCFTALQRGHRLREGALSVQLDARR